MNTKRLTEILSQISEKIKVHSLLADSKKAGFIEKIHKLQDICSSVEVPEAFEDLHNSLINRGNELLLELKKNKSQKELGQKITYYLRYVHASTFDFKGNITGINVYTRLFMITAALFMALTPQFYGFVLPVFFILPIFSGLKGVKRRSRTGLMMTLAVVPMALMSSITWIRYFFQAALPDFQRAIASTAASWNVSDSVAQLLIIIPSILSIVLVLISFSTVYFGYKYRDMFV